MKNSTNQRAKTYLATGVCKNRKEAFRKVKNERSFGFHGFHKAFGFMGV